MNRPQHPCPSTLALAIASLGAAFPLFAHADNSTAPVVLDDVVVYGQALPPYIADQADVGPLGTRSILNTPYSITAVPQALSDNQQLKNVKEIFRYLPSVQGENIRPQTRGFQAGVVQNTHIDGLNIISTTDYPTEQFDRIEVLNGLAGALYGPANPAGMFNYVLKRPTSEPVRQFTLGYGGKDSVLAHVDLGGQFDDGRFGYRVNLLDDDGEGYAPQSTLRRRLASVAFDMRLAPGTVLETNASTYHYQSFGFPGTFALANNVNFPVAPDATRLGYGQPTGGDDNVTDTVSARLKHELNPDWHLTAGVLRQSSDRASTVPTNTLTNNAGAYTTTAATTTFSLDRILSNEIALNGRVHTGSLSHDLTFANTGFSWDRYTPYQTGAITLGKASLSNPQVFNEPVWPDFSHRNHAMNTQQQSLTMGDTIGFSDAWSASLVASQSWISSNNYNKSGAQTSQYDDKGISTAANIMFKPQSNMSTYLSYADSLQQGDTAPSGVVNAGENLAPVRSKQWELGYKAEWSKFNFTTALFQIERPYAYTGSDNVYRVQGEQRNRGLELMANGEVLSNITVYGGITFLDPRLLSTGSNATNNTQILGLSRVTSNLLTEYRVPLVDGLTLSLNLHNASRRPGNNSNTSWVDGYTTEDLGARLVTHLLGETAIWRVALDNVGNKHYWANITPSGQNGYNAAGNGTGTLGAPRTVRASLQLDF